ncbi:MAG: metal-dependent transcriptional regulator [Deltaproteobacteria bacterium]|nr:metal-dependent transcriptional regulator [Deltaproteobacteria bacterium]
MEKPALSSALEDYLETIYQLISEQKFARVKEIALARNVKPGSVSQALKRLADLGLVTYVKREYIGLTPKGEREALRVLTRHRILKRFFREILDMPAEAAEEQACVMEHALANEGLDRLVRFFEFIAICPMKPPGFFENFHRCSLVHADVFECRRDCEGLTFREEAKSDYLSEVEPGEERKVVQIEASGDLRQRLLNMGFLPNESIAIDRISRSENRFWIRLKGNQLEISREEARAVKVSGLSPRSSD